ncbi:MAG: diiron oxygenase [Acidimicrobiia bacterium]
MTATATATPTTTPRTASDRIGRLSTASVRKVLEPEELFDWSSLGAGQVIGDELLTTRGLDLDLDAETKARLSREEVAAMLEMGIRFEAVLNSGFALQIAECRDVSDPRVTYMLHEIAEETRHQRAFIRLVEELAPRAKNPLARGVFDRIATFNIRRFIKMPAFLMVLVLAGEEIPDLLQKLASEHPDTDPLLRDVNRYHRQEESRHLSFARTTLPELYGRAGRLQRLRVRYFAPLIIGGLFATFVHPGVYASVGLPGFKTWRAVNRSPERIAVRHCATRNILKALLDAGIFKRGRIPRGWRKLCGVDRHGEPIPGDVALPGDVDVAAA